MQIFDPKGYAIACDKCGRRLEWSGRNVFKSAYAAVETAKTQGWKSSKSSPYGDVCPHCRKR